MAASAAARRSRGGTTPSAPTGSNSVSTASASLLLKIWIDADAAPRDVKELVFRAAKRLAIETILVANQRLQTPPGNPHIRAVWVDGSALFSLHWLDAPA